MTAFGSERLSAQVLVENGANDYIPKPFGQGQEPLVHAVLADVDLGGDEAHVRLRATASGRLLGASPEEIAAAASSAIAALEHPLLRRARASAERGDCRRETPLLLPLEDGTVIEGVVDLAFREAGAWTVVDFKTDVEIEGRRAKYEAQLRIYAEAIEKATGEPAAGVLLSV